LAAQPPVEPLLVVTGPTASGKTAMAIEIAARSGREILSMDSMAVYRRMDVGTAKPSAADRERVPHHLIDLVEPHEAFDTARWCAAAEQALAELAARGKRALFVGGTPLYLMAFFKGMLESPPSDPALRDALAAREAATPGSLHEELLRLDPQAAARIHPKDLRRLVRAHEVLQTIACANAPSRCSPTACSPRPRRSSAAAASRARPARPSATPSAATSCAAGTRTRPSCAIASAATPTS